MASTSHSRRWLETATCAFSAAPERMWRNTLATRTWRRVPASCARIAEHEPGCVPSNVHAPGFRCLL